MSLIERGLSKLTISAWKDREGRIPAGSLTVMYNPETIQMDYQTRYYTPEVINRTAQSNRYVVSEPVGLNLNLVFDAVMPGNTQPVEKQLSALKSLCSVDAATESPYFLKINWGKMRWENKGYFAGRASDLSITYTLFDRDATPLRATARLTLIADESFVVQHAEKTRQAPSSSLLSITDLATLPLLALEADNILSDGTDYLSLAWENDLDNLDDFAVGQYLQASKGGGE